MIRERRIIPVIDPGVRLMCVRPYPNHPRGCPNFNKRKDCPPKSSLWNDVCDKQLATWVFWTHFNLGAHRERMQKKHPTWTKRQSECCLYWQGTAKKPLKDWLKENWQFPGFFTTMCPESMGVNVTATMASIGVDLEWPPEKLTYQVAMGGWLL